MDIGLLVEVLGASSSSVLFVGAVIYLYKAQEKKEIREAQLQRERETLLGQRLDQTEDYIRTNLQNTIVENTKALHEMSVTLKELPCKECIHKYAEK